MSLRSIYRLFQDTFHEWSEDKAPRLGAALAYYSVFSIAPLLIIAIAVAGAIFGEQAAQGEIRRQLEGMVGETGARAVEDILTHTHNSDSGLLASLLSVAALLFGASGVFAQLQDALNTIWKVTPRPGRAILTILRDRFLSFTMVLGTGFLLLVSLVISAALQAATRLLASSSFAASAGFWQTVNALVSFAFVTLLFALIFKVLPDVKIGWGDVGLGAVLTALLFTAGKYLIGLYLGHAGVTSAYGAAGSLVVFLVWVYYSSQILLFGAEFTRVYARSHGRHIEPTESAVPVTAAARIRQGMPSEADVETAARAT